MARWLRLESGDTSVKSKGMNHAVDTVMRIIKLKIFSVPVHLHSGYGKLIFFRYFTIFYCNI